MLEKPDISDKLITSCLQEEYALHVARINFLPLGADLGTAVYRVDTTDGRAHFLKLRKSFEETTVTLPLFLHFQGVQEIVVPHRTRSDRHWTELGEYTLILYPFIEGKDGFERELTNPQKRGLVPHSGESIQPLCRLPLKGSCPQNATTLNGASI